MAKKEVLSTTIGEFESSINIHDAVLFFTPLQDGDYAFFLRVFQEVNEQDLKGKLAYRITCTPKISDVIDYYPDPDDRADEKFAVRNGYGTLRIKRIDKEDASPWLTVYYDYGCCRIEDCRIRVEQIPLSVFRRVMRRFDKNTSPAAQTPRKPRKRYRLFQRLKAISTDIKKNKK